MSIFLSKVPIMAADSVKLETEEPLWEHNEDAHINGKSWSVTIDNLVDDNSTALNAIKREMENISPRVDIIIAKAFQGKIPRKTKKGKDAFYRRNTKGKRKWNNIFGKNVIKIKDMNVDVDWNEELGVVTLKSK